MTPRRIPESATVLAAGDLLASAFGAELVILSLKDGVYYGLEDVGARIWGLLQRPITVSAIRDALVAEYDVEPERCGRDLAALLQDLAARGLIEVRERGDDVVA
ncbi:MAG: PqqD family peptide modification chaperone [Gemmatimonadales bacterium]|jgi:sulfur transfer complex TusBCD TusB component (DsrH family)